MKKIISILLCIAIMFSMTLSVFASMPFNDVKKSDWFYEDVQFVYSKGLMKGMSATKFEPHTAMSRAMVVTVLWRIENQPSATMSKFTDVEAGSWYADAVSWAAKNRIVEGVGNNKFAPNADVTREQIATILCRYAKYKGVYNQTVCAKLDSYIDVDKIADWATESVAWAVGFGLINGEKVSEGWFLNPQNNATRCQIAAILHRLCEKLL